MALLVLTTLLNGKCDCTISLNGVCLHCTFLLSNMCWHAFVHRVVAPVSS
jgi:hypothetical protein